METRTWEGPAAIAMSFPGILKPSAQELLRPILSGVSNSKNVYLVLDNFVDGDVGSGRKQYLASVLSQTRPSAAGKAAQS